MSELVPSIVQSAYCLDVGCGAGVWNTMMRELIEARGYRYVGINIAKEQLLSNIRMLPDQKQKDAAYILGDACKLPFSKRFNLVVALELIEHLDSPERMLSEIDALLLDDGYLLISTPNKFSLEGIKGKALSVLTEREWKDWDVEHKHVFSSPEFISLLSQHLTVKRVCGYYALPHLQIKFIQRINSYSRTVHEPFNRLCFQTIVLLKKRTAS